eukprot:scaffold7453_cov128-Isochrysis_galbana.AAC.7
MRPRPLCNISRGLGGGPSPAPRKAGAARGGGGGRAQPAPPARGGGAVYTGAYRRGSHSDGPSHYSSRHDGVFLGQLGKVVQSASCAHGHTDGDATPSAVRPRRTATLRLATSPSALGWLQLWQRHHTKADGDKDQEDVAADVHQRSENKPAADHGYWGMLRCGG